MPIVAKDRAEYELKRQRLLDDYAAFAKQREIYKKSKEHMKDTGMPLFQKDMPLKTTTEILLNKANLDKNLENFLVKNLDSQTGQAKIFVQSLDDDLKEEVFNKFPAFEKLFNKSFSIATAQNLKATLDLFLKGEMKKQKELDMPTIESIRKYLRDLRIGKAHAFFNEVIAANYPYLSRTEALKRITTPTTTPMSYMDRRMNEVRRFLKQYPSEIAGYSNLYNLAKKVGLNDFPKPTMLYGVEEAKTPFITVPVSLATAPEAEVVDVRKRMVELPKSELIRLINLYNDVIYPKAPLGSVMKPIPKSLKVAKKQDIVEALLARNYNISTGTFGRSGAAVEGEPVEESKGETGTPAESKMAEEPSVSGSGLFIPKAIYYLSR